jgi:hypothetical protein
LELFGGRGDGGSLEMRVRRERGGREEKKGKRKMKKKKMQKEEDCVEKKEAEGSERCMSVWIVLREEMEEKQKMSKPTSAHFFMHMYGGAMKVNYTFMM